MSAPLPYPVVWADAKTCGTLFGMAESTFREHVSSGLLPKPAPVGGKRLWRVSEVDEALAKLLPSAKDGDPVLDRIGRAGHGQAKRGGSRHAA
jgi:predicted DNA-binding transcriptional regulator AlpA